MANVLFETPQQALPRRWRGLPVFYETPEMRIGKHWWKCIVTSYCNDRCTYYLWRRWDEWHSHEQWPRYTGNGFYGGLPKTLAKLYRQHEADIQRALKGTDHVALADRR